MDKPVYLHDVLMQDPMADLASQWAARMPQ